ncbi:carbohydrate ABC transporter permease [Mycoplasmopsis glycophila]|uniref:sn-glycerol-3-phosphate transport system permease protein ugpA n=1 Tax=Mycoplasmopsis glycophila TaxID=171285 RepID=A0A449AUK8_9BACT|nr:sugar ABC transporter permease [Mycoplasmopsis glycophila]VEU70160.1 sn-glycerol-3-phosphate transport system permease protein ugpA [Mycoplasmopsis glycophila]
MFNLSTFCFKFRQYFRSKFSVAKKQSSLRIIDAKAPFWKPFLLLTPSILIILLFTIIPFILTIITAFESKVGFHNETVWTSDNFRKILDPSERAGQQFYIAVRNSFVYSIAALPISLCISILIASSIFHIVNKYLRGAAQTIFFLPYVTNAIAVGLTFYYLFGGTETQDRGLINMIFGSKIPWLKSGEMGSWLPFVVILVRGVWGNLAFQILILTSAMLGVNKQLYKSAAIDGAYKSKQFFFVTLPSIQKTISFLITVGLIGGIKVFPLAIFNNQAKDAINNGGGSLMLLIYYYITDQGNFYMAGALSVYLVVIGIVVSFTLRKLIASIFTIANKKGERYVYNKIANKANVSETKFKI